MFSWLFSDPLKAGDDAPAFALPDQDGMIVSLESLSGRNVVLVFYPADETTICTRQLCEFRDHWAAAQAKNTVVLGVNPAGPQKHAAFREHHRFPFPLLVDKGQQTAAKYHANGLIREKDRLSDRKVGQDTLCAPGKAGSRRSAGRSGIGQV
jgi:peroxiredoxin Q/BCP